MRRTLAVAAALVAVAAGILVLRTQSNAGQAPKPQPVAVAAAPELPIERYDVPVSSAQPQQGRADAPITIVEFGDFQCPFSDTVRSSLREVQQTYGDQVRLVWRNQPLPIHESAKLAAEAAQEAFAQGGDAKFWAMHDALFADRDHLERKDLERRAAELGLDGKKFAAALDAHKHTAAVDADMLQGRKLGVRGTPGFFINGRPLAGAKPTIAFREIIDDELQRVQQLRARGVSADAVYVALTSAAPKLLDPRSAISRAVGPTVYKIPVSERDPQQGPADALVTLIMFGDFEDKFTRRAAETVNAMRQKYSNDLRVVWKDLPLAFHEHATHAATLAQEAFAHGGSELFWQAHALLLANHEGLGDPALLRFASELGLDAAKVEQAFRVDKYKAQFEQTKALVPRLSVVQTTPLFTVNGRLIRGALAPAVYDLTIEQEVVKAKQLVASGTPRSALYEQITRNGRTEDAELTPAQSAVVNKVYELPVPRDAASKGPANATIVIQEFADFQCPFCARAESTLADLMREYEGKIRLVWRDYPLANHADAELSAQAAREIYRQGKDAKFWAYHQLLFANQAALTRADLERYAERVGGIDLAKFRRALDQHTHAARVKADADAYAKSGAGQGTPGFFINGRYLEGALPIELFRAVINRELQNAK